MSREIMKLNNQRFKFIHLPYVIQHDCKSNTNTETRKLLSQ